MWYFTADEHYGHTAIIDHCRRPFGSSGEMDKTIMANFNSVVTSQDVTIHAGDFCWLNSKKEAYETYVSKLNGTHIFLIGSHDHWLPESARYIWRRRIDNILVMVCHYAMRTWECSHYNSFQLFAHSHGRLEPVGKQYDIGVDNNNYFPVSWDDIKRIMADRPDNFNYAK